ncbi:MAG: DUF6660 family protein [Bacteroidota bacterium]
MKKNIGTRVICVFLAGYVLLLALMPCMDDVISQVNTTPLPGTGISVPGHADHPGCCSPFCSCSCCNVAMEVTQGCVISGIAFLSQKLVFPDNRHRLSDYSMVAWEPPKV